MPRWRHPKASSGFGVVAPAGPIPAPPRAAADRETKE
jgi:hypothetical protein